MRSGIPVNGVEYRVWLPTGECVYLVEDFCRHANMYCSDDHLTVQMADAAGPATVTDVAAIGRATWCDVADALHDRPGPQP